MAANQEDGENGSGQRKSFSTLAQSIVENQLLTDDAENLELTEEMKEMLAKRRGKQNKPKSNVLDIEFMRQRYASGADVDSRLKLQLSAQKVSINELNKMLTTSVSSSRKRSRSSSQQLQSNDSSEEQECPLCSRSLAGLSALQISKHFDRCSRRGSKSTSLADESSERQLRDMFDTFDRDDEVFESHRELSNPRTKRKTPMSRSYNDDSDIFLAEEDEALLLDAVGGDNDEDDITKAASHKDDWEEDDYRSRLGRLADDKLESQDTSFGSKVCRQSWENLFEYQREGCKWLFSLFREGVGGILADEMGLGKTAQVAVHFGSLGKMNHQLNQKKQAVFLIVCPATVLVHWVKEMHRWAPTMRTGILHTISATGKEILSLSTEDLMHVLKNLRRSDISEGITVITSYETMRRSVEALTAIEWTAVCLDEGHKIRNPDAAVTIACKQLPAFHRLILSGTPIQNSLLELWCLFDFIYPGKLGNRQVFEDEFAYPIRMGAYAHASKLQYEIAIRCAGTLQRMVRPYLLRRKKDDLAQVANLPPKTEQVLFCPISTKQRTIYEQVLDSDEVKKVIARRIPAFRAINQLRKLCNHPALVYQDGALQWSTVKDMRLRQKLARDANTMLKSEMQDDQDEEDDTLQERLESTGAQMSQWSSGDASNRILWSDSGKLLVLSKILPIWKREGHKVLVFCQTTSMLHIIEQMVISMKFSYLRLDGQTPIGKRDHLIQQYNTDPSVFVMLLTTRTGGVGISLTAANRIVLFDPDWNPMTDIQARERAWRLGQLREVVIYRLITKGTIEEKIYHRQIFKLLLSHRVLDDPKQKNLFSKSQLQELFELAPEMSDSSIAADHREFQQSQLGIHASFLENHRAGDRSGIPGRELPAAGQVPIWHNDDDDQGEGDTMELDTSAQFRSHNPNESSSISLSQHRFATKADSEVASFHIETMTAEKQQEEAAVYDMLVDIHGGDAAAVDTALGVEEDDEDQINSSQRKPSRRQSTSSLSSIGNKNEHQAHDRKLLRALFDGEAIVSIYSHDFLEPGHEQKQKSKQQQEEARRLAQVADRRAQRAVQSLQSSSAVYQPSQPTASNELNQFNSTSSSSTATQSNRPTDVLSRYFGNVSANQQDAEQASSTSLLAAIRQRDSQLHSSNPKEQPIQNVSEVTGGIEEQLRARLLSAFRAQPSLTISTNGILQQFRDLGDQYAPLFRRLLRSVAILKEGTWVLRNKYK